MEREEGGGGTERSIVRMDVNKPETMRKKRLQIIYWLVLCLRNFYKPEICTWDIL